MTAKAAKRTLITEDWQPDSSGLSYALEHGVSPDIEVEKFRDYHLMHGNTMASWPAAWRTWVRNAGKFSEGRSCPRSNVSPYGINEWCHTRRDAVMLPFGGEMRSSIGGFDLARVATEACIAARIPAGTRPDLDPLADWLRHGCSLDDIVRAIETADRRPDRPNLRWYTRAVLERKGRS